MNPPCAHVSHSSDRVDVTSGVLYPAYCYASPPTQSDGGIRTLSIGQLTQPAITYSDNVELSAGRRIATSKSARPSPAWSPSTSGSASPRQSHLSRSALVFVLQAQQRSTRLVVSAVVQVVALPEKLLEIMPSHLHELGTRTLLRCRTQTSQPCRFFSISHDCQPSVSLDTIAHARTRRPAQHGPVKIRPPHQPIPRILRMACYLS